MATGEPTPARLAPVTEDLLRRSTDSSSYSQGQSYYRNDYIFETVLRGDTLSARSRGHSGGPYRIKVALAPAGGPADKAIVTYGCTCPRGGFCKHIVATLLTWIHAPERFEARQDVVARLQTLSRDELLHVLTGLLKQKPDLDRRVERLLPKLPQPKGQGPASLNAARIQKQAAAAFARGYDWDEDEEADEEDDPFADLLTLGEQNTEAGHWANAQIVYSAMIKEAIEHWHEWVEADDDSLYEAIETTVEGLLRVLEAQAAAPPARRLDAAARAALFRTLYDTWRFAGNYDFEQSELIPEAIARAATPAEREQIEGWVRGQVRGDFEDRTVVAFLLALKGEAGESDEVILEEYRRAGLYSDLAERLLTLGRTEEALTVAEQHVAEPMAAWRFFEQLLGRGEPWVERAVAFGEKRLTNPQVVARFAERLVPLGEPWIGRAVVFAEKRLTTPYEVAHFAEQLLSRGEPWAGRAVTFAEKRLTTPNEAIRFAERLLSLGGPWIERALAFVEARLRAEEAAQQAAQQAAAKKKRPQDWEVMQRDRYIAQYLEWLEKQYIAHGRAQQGLELALRRFDAQPGMATYDAVRAAVYSHPQPGPLWAETRPRLVAALEAQGMWNTLIEIHLREGAAREALDALTTLEAHTPAPAPGLWGGRPVYPTAITDLRRRVAQAAEKEHPAAARAIYERLAEQQIEGRNRPSYQIAAAHIQRIKELYLHENDSAGWRAYITDLLSRRKTLRALHEELDSHGLTK